MTKDDIGPISEFGAIVGSLAGEAIRAQIMEGSEGMAEASPEEAATWLRGAVERLDAATDPQTRARIMEQMGRNCAEMNKGAIEGAWAKRRQFETLDAFLEAEEKHPSRGTRLVRKGHIVHQYYKPLDYGMRCYCALWRGLQEDQTVSPTWCQCGRAFAARVWEGHVGRPVKVEVAQCCIAGAQECEFVINLSQPASD